MDVAIPISGGDNSYIIYIRDNRSTVSSLNSELLIIILQALLVGLLISVLLSFLLSKTMINPIEKLTEGAERIATGDFDETLAVESTDEIGVLTTTFNDMASVLHSTLEAVENERNKLDTLFLHMSDGVVAYDGSGKLIHCNPAACELLGRTADECVYSELFESICPFSHVITMQRSDYVEGELTVGERSVELYFAPFSDEESGGVLIVLHDVTASVEREDRIGIVGQNGAGKTTLLKILTGVYTDYDGEFSVTHGVTLGYLEQNAKLDATLDIYGEMRATFAPVLDAMAQMQILERRMAAQPDNADLLAQHDALQNIVDAADGYNMDVNIKKVLSGMGFAQDTWQKNIAVLSGGELTRLRLAKLLLEKPDVLILDEPTNHLDFATMEWLENYLKSYSGAVLVVSHDRYFLDNVCTKIWEVSFQTMTTYKGNFSAYLPQKEAADALRQKQHDADVALAEKLQDYVDRNLVRASTTKMAQSRRKQLEKLEITEAPKDETNQLKFRFEYDVEPWNELVMLKNLSIKIGERTLLEPFTYTVCRGQRLIIAGPNGAGKSTLMQVLDGKRRPSGGMVRLGTGARPSIFAQQQNRLGQGRVIDVIWNKYPRMTELEVRSHLAKLGFRGDTVFKPCEALSGGELARLRFAEIVLERPNLLFLDEPTNHLDIYTRENLTEALMAYTGTLLLVTHDRHLMNSLACPILYLEDGKAVLYPSYDALMGRAAPAQAAQKAAEPAKTGYGKEQRRRRAELRAKIKACEDEMEACGAREVELDNEINSPEVYNDPDLLRQKSDELSDLRFHQEELFAAWEAAMEEQEAYEQTQQPEE